MLDSAVDHLIHNVLDAAADYVTAEGELSRAYAADQTPAMWEAAARLTKRRAAELAIAIDGLPDRCETELGLKRADILKLVEALCVLPPGTQFPYRGCIERIRGVANAYKHKNLRDQTLPISSDSDVLVVALGYGIGVYGAGKFGGVEVIVREKTGGQWKFLADAPTAVAAWFRFLSDRSATLPSGPYHVCGLQVHPL